MLKLLKYEFRKNMYGMAVMGGIIGAAQLYFMYACFIADNRNMALGGAWLLFFGAMVCFFMVFAMGIVTYSKELSNKTSYLVFMTPNSSIRIIGSKLLYTFLNGAIVLAVLMILGVIDWGLLMDMWRMEVSIIETMLDFMAGMGIDMHHIVYSIVVVIIKFLVDFFLAVTLAYMCITMTATVLQNRKVSGLISFILYVLVFYVVNKLGSLLPRLYKEPSDMTQAAAAGLPCTLFFLIIIAGAIVATAQLLERKVSL